MGSAACSHGTLSMGGGGRWIAPLVASARMACRRSGVAGPSGCAVCFVGPPVGFGACIPVTRPRARCPVEYMGFLDSEWRAGVWFLVRMAHCRDASPDAILAQELFPHPPTPWSCRSGFPRDGSRRLLGQDGGARLEANARPAGQQRFLGLSSWGRARGERHVTDSRVLCSRRSRALTNLVASFLWSGADLTLW